MPQKYEHNYKIDKKSSFFIQSITTLCQLYFTLDQLYLTLCSIFIQNKIRYVWSFPILIFLDGFLIHLKRKSVIFRLLTSLTHIIANFNPSSHFFRGHTFEEKSHFDGFKAFGTVNCYGIELSADTKRTFVFFMNPGGKASTVIEMTTKGDDITVILKTNGAVIIDIDDIWKLFVHIKVM